MSEYLYCYHLYC